MHKSPASGIGAFRERMGNALGRCERLVCCGINCTCYSVCKECGCCRVRYEFDDPDSTNEHTGAGGSGGSANGGSNVVVTPPATGGSASSRILGGGSDGASGRAGGGGAHTAVVGRRPTGAGAGNAGGTASARVVADQSAAEASTFLSSISTSIGTGLATFGQRVGNAMGLHNKPDGAADGVADGAGADGRVAPAAPTGRTPHGQSGGGFLGLDFRRLMHGPSHARYAADADGMYRPPTPPLIPAPAPKPVRRGPDIPQRPHIPVVGDAKSGKSTFIYTAAVGRYPTNAGHLLNLQTAESPNSTVGLVQLLDTVTAAAADIGAAGTASAAHSNAASAAVTAADVQRAGYYRSDKCRAVVIVCSMADPASMQAVITRWAPDFLAHFSAADPDVSHVVATRPSAGSGSGSGSGSAAGGADSGTGSSVINVQSASGDDDGDAKRVEHSPRTTHSPRPWRMQLLVLATHADEYHKPHRPTTNTAAATGATAAAAADLEFDDSKSAAAALPAASSSSAAVAQGSGSAASPFAMTIDVSPPLLMHDSSDSPDGGSGSGSSAPTTRRPRGPASGAASPRGSISGTRTPLFGSSSALGGLVPFEGAEVEVGEGVGLTVAGVNDAPVLAPTFADSIPTSDFLGTAAGLQWAAALTSVMAAANYSDALTFAECDSHDLQAVRSILDSLLHASEIRESHLSAPPPRSDEE